MEDQYERRGSVNTAHSQPRPFTCRRCGGCCRIRGFVRVSAEEIDRIAAFLGIPPRVFADRYTRIAHDRQRLELEEKVNGECVFLEGAECLVHTVKPEQCRTFPDGWRYPGVEEICPAYRQEIPNPKSQIPNPNMKEIPNPKFKIPNPKSQHEENLKARRI